ncbi:hypothetical protein TNCV_2239291 [Trichonephila clavipes]|nr:hypothetical protein TNCV_2239291 [Trichonephila clavipes]
MPSEVPVDRWEEVDGLQFVGQAYPTHALLDSSPVMANEQKKPSLVLLTFRVSLARQLIDGYSSRKRKGRPASFQAKRVVPVDLHFTTVIPSTWKASKIKSPIIFIHGLFDSGISWNRVKNSICEDTGRKGYIITLRNHGKSVWSDEITTEHFIADLENFMANQNISRAIIVAHSIGAKPAMHLALRKLECIGGIEFPCCQLSCRLPKWKAKTRHGVSFVSDLLKALKEDLKHQPVYQDSHKDASSSLSLKIELAIPFTPNQDPQDIPQQLQRGEVVHYHPSE